MPNYEKEVWCKIWIKINVCLGYDNLGLVPYHG